MLRYINFKLFGPLSSKCLKIYFIYYLLDFITFKLRKVLKTLSASERDIQTIVYKHALVLLRQTFGLLEVIFGYCFSKNLWNSLSFTSDARSRFVEILPRALRSYQLFGDHINWTLKSRLNQNQFSQGRLKT